MEIPVDTFEFRAQPVGYRSLGKGTARLAAVNQCVMETVLPKVEKK